MCDDIKMLVSDFIVYARPMLEYNCVIWSPNLKSDIMQLEKSIGSSLNDSEVFSIYLIVSDLHGLESSKS